MGMAIPFWTRDGSIDMADLRDEDLSAEILGDTLAKLNRFGGRTTRPWSVAAHSVLVEKLCPLPIRPWALLHDAHEAFVGDIATPAVDLIETLGVIDGFDRALARAKGALDVRIARGWGVSVRSMNHGLLQADRIALVAEAIFYLDIPPKHFEPGDGEEIERAVGLLIEMSDATDWRVARDLWLGRVRHYAARGQMTPPTSVRPRAYLT